MKKIQVQLFGAASLLLALLSFASFSIETAGSPAEGSPYYGRVYRGGNEKNRMVFPDEKERYSVISKDVKREVNDDDGCCYDDIPLELALMLGNISSSDDIFTNGLVDPDTIDNRIFSNGYGERSAGEVPKPAGCNTAPAIVSLRPESATDPLLIYSPSCTRVDRCSGCCVSNRFSCQPTSTRTRTFTVNVMEYKTGTKLRFKHREPVLIEEHVGCACQCRVKPEHCNAFQRYSAASCRCECTNNDDRSKCIQEQDIKYWDSDTCLCKCRKETNCTTGSYFDQNYCRCLQRDFYVTH